MIFSPYNPSRLLDLIETEKLVDYTRTLLELGFENERTQVRLFANEKMPSDFDLVDLNNNFEPLLMSKFAVVCLKHICNQVI